jgi:rhodanese-related sulfurtransferase
MRLLPLLFLCGSVLSNSPALAAEPSKAPSSPDKSSSQMKKTTNLTPSEAETLLQTSTDLVVIDVRTQEEFAEGHIAGARNVNFNSPTFAEQMKAFTGKKILVHCAAGGRSTRALEALSGTPFEQVYHLNKGFNAWVEAGKPVSTKP